MASDGFRLQITKLNDDGRDDGHGCLGAFFPGEDVIEEEIFSVGGHEAGAFRGDDTVEKKFEVTMLLVLVVTSPGQSTSSPPTVIHTLLVSVLRGRSATTTQR